MTFTTAQVSDLADVSLRQLQWWTERNLIDVTHEGHSRVWTQDEAMDAMVIAEFRHKGLSLQRVRRIMDKLRKVELEEESVVLVWGIRVQTFTSDTDAIEAAAKAPCSVTLLTMEPILRDISALKARLRREAIAALSAAERKSAKSHKLFEHELRDAGRSATR